MITSISKTLAQQIVYAVSDVCEKNVNFISPEGIIVASTNESRIGTFHEIGRKAAETLTTQEVDTDEDFAGTRKGINMPIFHNKMLIAVVGISGEPDEVRKYAQLAERITSLLIREQELNQLSRGQSEKRHFIIQSLIGDDPYNQDYLRDCLSDFRINAYTPKRILLIRVHPRYNVTNLSLLEPQIIGLFEHFAPSVFSYNYPSEYLCIVDDAALQRDDPYLRSFLDNNAGFLTVAVGRKTPLFELKKSWETAQTAMRSLIQKNTSSFAVFDDLLLEIVLSDIRSGSAQEFTSRTLKKLSAEDKELLRIYFQNNLSLLHTAEKLFIHKNTVQYKLNSIAEHSGLNPRQFEEAVLLYLGLAIENQHHM